MRAACIQLSSGTDIHDNIRAAETLIRKAADAGATLICTPETTHLMQRNPKDLYASIFPEKDDPGVSKFAALAKELEIDLIIGSLAIKSKNGRALNRSFVFGPDGQIKARYDKIHLFDVTLSKTLVYRESQTYDHGGKAVIAQTSSARIGLSICYDLRFARLYRALSQAGADILSIPAAFTKPTGEAHWAVLQRARAIETGCFVLAPAQGGIHADGRQTWGHSMIIDPWGRVLACLENDEPGLIYSDIDINAVAEARGKVPAWQHDPNFSL